MSWIEEGISFNGCWKIWPTTAKSSWVSRPGSTSRLSSSGESSPRSSSSAVIRRIPSVGLGLHSIIIRPSSASTKSSDIWPSQESSPPSFSTIGRVSPAATETNWIPVLCCHCRGAR
jgi:hypothetical protein